jgi:uncharacterized protein YlaI
MHRTRVELNKWRCAACDAEHARDGKVFEIEVLRSNSGRSTFVWLCASCSKRFTVEWHSNKPFVVPVRVGQRVRAMWPDSFTGADRTIH